MICLPLCIYDVHKINLIFVIGRMEFVRMKGPMGKGHAEMAVSKTKNSDYVTPDYDGDFPIQGWDQELPLPGGFPVATDVVVVVMVVVGIENYLFQLVLLLLLMWL